MKANADFARQAFDAMAAGDTDWLTAHMHPDVIFHQGGRFPTAGTYVGRDAVFGHMMAFFTMVDFSMKLDVHDIAATDDHVISLVRVSVDFDGRHLDFDEAHVWHVIVEPFRAGEGVGAIADGFDLEIPDVEAALRFEAA